MVQVFSILTGVAMTFLASPSRPSVEGIDLDFEFQQSPKGSELVVKITNRTEDERELQTPYETHALQFVVMSKSGSRILGERAAKATPSTQRVRLKPDEARTFPIHDRLQAADGRQLYFPYLFDGGLVGHPMKDGVKYRVIAVYRPFGMGHAGVCSQEHIVRIPAGGENISEAEPPTARHRSIEPPHQSADAAVEKAREHTTKQGIDIGNHFVYMVETLGLNGKTFWRVTWILKSPSAGKGRIYVDVHDDGNVTHLIRSANPPQSTLSVPQTSIDEALDRGKAYVNENDLQISESFLKRITASQITGNTHWTLAWWRNSGKGGQIYVHVYDDGSVNHSYGR